MDDLTASDGAGAAPAASTLRERVEDVLDEGYSPPERPLAVEATGITAEEQRRRETLEQRLAHEVPDISVPEGDGLGDSVDSDGEVIDDEVGGPRSGRLVAPDEGAHPDDEPALVATDVGIDGAAASAEEAAVHVVVEEEEPVREIP